MQSLYHGLSTPLLTSGNLGCIVRPNMPQEITVSRAAELADVSSQYILAEIKRGKFPNAYQVEVPAGSAPWLIPLKDFEAWQKKRAQAHKT